MNKRIEDQLKGEKALAKIGLQVLPEIEAFFKPLDGCKIKLKSGYSSKAFNKQMELFKASLSLPKGAHMWIDLSHSSVYVQIKTQSQSFNDSWNYFNQGIFAGRLTNEFDRDIEAGVYTYKEPCQSHIEAWKRTLKTSVKSLEAKRAKYEAFMTKANEVRASVPYSLQDLIGSV